MLTLAVLAALLADGDGAGGAGSAGGAERRGGAGAGAASRHREARTLEVGRDTHIFPFKKWETMGKTREIDPRFSKILGNLKIQNIVKPRLPNLSTFY